MTSSIQLKSYPFKDVPHPNEKISESGVYPLSMNRYHSDCCVGPSISSSGLRILVDEHKAPAHYWCDSYLNPEREEPDEEKEHFTLGQAAHIRLLGEAGFDETFAVRPDMLGGKAWHGNRTECKLWKQEQKALGKAILKQEDMKIIEGMERTIARDDLVNHCELLTGMVEQSLIWQDKETGVWLKARPDVLPVHQDAVVDIKTIAAADYRSCEKSNDDYAYHIQLALAGMGILELTGRELGNDDYILLFIEKRRPYCCNIKIIQPDVIQLGKMLARKAIRIFAECLNKGEWPGYADSGGYLNIPKWRREQYERDIKNGMLDDRGL